MQFVQLPVVGRSTGTLKMFWIDAYEDPIQEPGNLEHLPFDTEIYNEKCRKNSLSSAFDIGFKDFYWN